MSMRDVVAAAGCCRMTVYRDIAAGKLRSFKMGKKRCFLAADYEAWLASHGARVQGADS